MRAPCGTIDLLCIRCRLSRQAGPLLPPASTSSFLPLRLSGVRQVPQTPNPKTPQTQKTPNNINVMALAGSPRSKSHHHHHHQQQQQQQQMGRVCFNDPYVHCPGPGGLVSEIDCTLSEMQSHLTYNLPPTYSTCTLYLLVTVPAICLLSSSACMSASDQLHMSFTADLTYPPKSQGLPPGTALILKEL